MKQVQNAYLDVLVLGLDVDDAAEGSGLVEETFLNDESDNVISATEV